jgi:hypothetical protein
MAALKKEDFTEEQWTEIQAETDRRATAASNTARTNALKEAGEALPTKIAEAVEAERKKLEMGEEERLKVEREGLAADKAAIAAERRSLGVTKKLLAAGYTEDAVTPLIPLFVGLDDVACGESVDSFIKTNAEIVKAQVDSVKQGLLNNATPPAGSNNAPVDATAAAAAALKTGDSAAAVDALLTAAEGATQ